MNVLITLTLAGSSTGPFNLFSNTNGYAIAFETGVPKASLVAGYTSTLVPAGTTTIKVLSTGVCNTSVLLPITGLPSTTTTTTTAGSGTTTTTTTQVVTYYNTVLCGTSTPSVIRHNGPNNVTLGVIVQSTNGQCYTVSSVGSGPETVGTLLTQFASCVLCQGAPAPTTTTTTTVTPTTTTTTTASPTTTTTTTAGLYRVWNLYRSEGETNPACSTTPASQVIEYNSNYTVGLVFKGSNGFCYTIANDGYQVSAPNITLGEEFGNCTECTESAPATTTTTTTATPPSCGLYRVVNNDSVDRQVYWYDCDTSSLVIDTVFANSNYNTTCANYGTVGTDATSFTIDFLTSCTPSAPTTTTTTTARPIDVYTFNITAGYESFAEACSEGGSATQIFGYNILFLDNAIFYNSSSLNVPYAGGNLYYKNTGENTWSRITDAGENSLEGTC